MPSDYRANTFHQTARREPEQLDWASDDQQFIFNYGPAPICASGGFGAGKTIGFLRKIQWLMAAFPGYRVAIARSHYEDLKTTTRPSFFKICPPEAYEFGRRADSDKSLKLNPVLCGDGKIRQSEIIWMHFDDPAIAEVIKGLEINAFLLDQAEDMQEDIFEKLLGRLGRWDDVYVPRELIEFWNTCGYPWEFYSKITGEPLAPTYAMLTCNPEDELHWIYRRFHPESPDFDAEHQREDGTVTSYKRQGYQMVEMDSTKNKFLSNDNLERMLNNDEVFVRKYVKGKWGNPEGVIHTVHKQSIIEWTPEIDHWIHTTCRLHRILDHGDSAPTCCTWWATDRDANLICYREYYQPNKLISQHREALVERSHYTRPDGHTQRESYDNELADPAIFIKTMQKYGGKWSVADEYSDCVNLPEDNAVFWLPADNNEMATRNRLSEYLRLDPEHINPFTKTRNSPRIFFIQKSMAYPHGCQMLIREIRSQKREQIGTQLGKPIFSEERVEGVPDHAYDTARYMVAARPGKAYKDDPTLHPDSFASVRRDMIQRRRRGGLTLMGKQAAREYEKRWGRG